VYKIINIDRNDENCTFGQRLLMAKLHARTQELVDLLVVTNGQQHIKSNSLTNIKSTRKS